MTQPLLLLQPVKKVPVVMRRDKPVKKRLYVKLRR